MNDVRVRKDIRLELRVKNNALYRAIFETHGSVAAFCRSYGLNQCTVGKLLNLKESPFNKDGSYRALCLRIAENTGLGVEELFPARLYETVKVPFRVIELDSFTAIGAAAKKQLAALPAPDDKVAEEQEAADKVKEAIDAVLRTLSYREREVVKLRYGLNEGNFFYTLEEVARIFELSSARVRQIEVRAINKLKRGKRRVSLAGLLLRADGEERNPVHTESSSFPGAERDDSSE